MLNHGSNCARITVSGNIDPAQSKPTDTSACGPVSGQRRPADRRLVHGMHAGLLGPPRAPRPRSKPGDRPARRGSSCFTKNMPEWDVSVMAPT